MADIIRESGLSSGAIYSHFDTKADLVRFAMTNMLEARFTALAGLPPGTPGVRSTTPHNLLEQLLSGPAEHRVETTVLLQVWAEMAQDPDLAAVAEENIDRLRWLLAQSLLPWAQDRPIPGRPTARTAEAAADWLVTLLFGYSTRLALQPGTDAASLRSELLTTAEQLETRPGPTAPAEACDGS